MPAERNENSVPVGGSGEPRGRIGVLGRHRWLTFLLPLIVFVSVTTLEPTPETPGGERIGLAVPYQYYPLVYAVKIALTVAAIALVWPGYRQFPFRVNPVAILVGIVGIVVWVGFSRLQIEQQHLRPLLERVGMAWLIDAGQRSAFDPRSQWDCLWGAYAFLALRLAGLALVAPLVEEFFYRGFLMRLILRDDWWNVPMGECNKTAAIVATVLPMAVHPAELVAAGVWFSMITWMYVKTRNVWDCVAAHAVTNLLLGVYVITTGDWRLL